MQKQNLFITGATGLLGRSILFELADFFTITALKRESSNTHGLPKSITWITGDLDNFEAIEKEIAHADVVIHAAAKVNFNPKHGERTMQFNITTTKQIVDTCLTHSKRLIHVSSVAALGGLTNTTITEQSAFDLDGINTDYARSKYFSEIEVWRGIAEGLNAVIVNPSIILGIPSAFPESSGIFWKQIDNGLPFYPTGSTGFVDARDVAKIIHQILKSEITGERFVVSGENLSYRAFFTEVAKSMNKKAPKTPLKVWQSSALWRVSSLLRLTGINTGYTKALHQTTKANITFDATKVKETLHFEFTPIQKSIAWVSDQYKNQKSK